MSLRRVNQFSGAPERPESRFLRAEIMRAAFLQEIGRHSLPIVVGKSEQSGIAVIELFDNGGIQ